MCEIRLLLIKIKRQSLSNTQKSIKMVFQLQICFLCSTSTLALLLLKILHIEFKLFSFQYVSVPNYTKTKMSFLTMIKMWWFQIQNLWFFFFLRTSTRPHCLVAIHHICKQLSTAKLFFKARVKYPVLLLLLQLPLNVNAFIQFLSGYSLSLS